MQEFESKKEGEYDGGSEIYSITIRVGKRTYYLDVKSTLGGDHFLTITESRRKSKGDNNGFSVIRQSIHIYPEDFDKVKGGIEVAMEKINELQSAKNHSATETEPSDDTRSAIDIEFDSL